MGFSPKLNLVRLFMSPRAKGNLVILLCVAARYLRLDNFLISSGMLVS